MHANVMHSRAAGAIWTMLSICLIGALPGCAASTRAQMGLTTQARKGVAMWTAREEGRLAEVSRQFLDRRKTLDEAFDADVRRRAQIGEALDAAWVIESRKAYAIGVEALARSESAAIQSAQTAKANAAATDALLAKLQSLQTARLSLETLIPNLIFSQGEILIPQGASDEHP